MFEVEYDKFLEEQRRSASGQRQVMLNKDLTGEKKLLSILWSVLKSFDGIILEYEIISISGVRIYIDVYYEPLLFAFESEGFVVHAENITRDRFSFERMRVRTMVANGLKYIPFSWDELDKKPEVCRRAIYELLGRFSSMGNEHSPLTVNEREVLRYVLRLNRPFKLGDVRSSLQLGAVASRTVIRKLLAKNLVRPFYNSNSRMHKYVVDERTTEYLF